MNTRAPSDGQIVRIAGAEKMRFACGGPSDCFKRAHARDRERDQAGDEQDHDCDRNQHEPGHGESDREKLSGVLRSEQPCQGRYPAS